MSLLKREEWYDVGRDTNWTPRYVKEEELFPEALSGAMEISAEAWQRWDEPYKMTFREYVETQREKDGGAYSVKAATTFPVVCNMCCIPIVGTPGPGWQTTAGPRAYWLAHEGRRYTFCSEECRWIFRVEPGRYAGHLGFIDRVVRGMVPPGIEGALDYMGIGPGERGEDAEGERWMGSHQR